MRSVISVESCTRNHSFPWAYSDTSWSIVGAMLCPSCGTDVARLWVTA